MAGTDDKIDMLCNTLLKVHEDNVRLLTVVERQAKSTETIAHHLDANIPAIMAKLGVVEDNTGAHRLQDPTALRMWDRFAAAPARVQRLVVILIVAAILSGW